MNFTSNVGLQRPAESRLSPARWKPLLGREPYAPPRCYGLKTSTTTSTAGTFPSFATQ